MGEIASFEKGRSPFSPGRPVPPEMFVGRDAQISRMLRAVGQVVAGKQENLFVTGEYGIGKSSLAAYVRSTAEQKYRLAGYHVLLGGVSSLEGMVQHVVSRVIQQAHRNNVLDRIRSLVARYVESVELFSVRINVPALRSDAPQIAQDFLPFLRHLWATLRGDYAGVGLYLDDLNGITGCPDFAALIKSLVDEIATSGQELPLLLTLVGVPQRRLEILSHQPPVERIFDIVEVTPLSDGEVETFFRNAFASANMAVEEPSPAPLTFFSGGLPKLMHELGEATYWVDTDNRVDVDDALRGVFEAADTVGRKYFERIRAALRSSDYHSILRRLGELRSDLTFSRTDLARGLRDAEKAKLDNFLQRMKSLHALHRGEVRGQWVFPNRLVQFYLVLEAARQRGSRNVWLPKGALGE